MQDRFCLSETLFLPINLLRTWLPQVAHATTPSKTPIIPIMTDLIRESFLEKASRQMFAASPSTSAHIAAENISLNRSVKPNNNYTQTCGGCGTLAVPCWTSSTLAGAKRGKLAGTPSSQRKQLQPKSASRKCKICGSVTKLSHHNSQKPKRHASEPVKPTKVESPTAEVPLSIPQRPTSDSKVSSKKRARARKDREGLQALLNKNKGASATPALDLMDFMKS